MAVPAVPPAGRTALLVTAHLWVPIPEASLPAPRQPTLPREVAVADAKRAVAVVCRHVNAAGRVLAVVRESSPGGRR